MGLSLLTLSSKLSHSNGLNYFLSLHKKRIISARNNVIIVLTITHIAYEDLNYNPAKARVCMSSRIYIMQHYSLFPTFLSSEELASIMRPLVRSEPTYGMTCKANVVTMGNIKSRIYLPTSLCQIRVKQSFRTVDKLHIR